MKLSEAKPGMLVSLHLWNHEGYSLKVPRIAKILDVRPDPGTSRVLVRHLQDGVKKTWFAKWLTPLSPLEQLALETWEDDDGAR